MDKNSLKSKIKYEFDNMMSKGTIALIGWLAVICLILILCASALVWVANLAPGVGFNELMWMCLMRTMDAGTIGGDSGSWLFLLIMFIITMGGIFIFSILIGLLTTGIEGKIESLRKGKSLVIEKDHTIILGWSDRVFTIIPELIAANSNKKSSSIVIMGDKDKVEMEDEIRERVGQTGNTKIVCRQGSPIDLNDLAIVNIDDSKSIIIVDNSDANVIKCVLAIVNNPNRCKKAYNIIASIENPSNLEVARLVGKNEAEFILADNLIAKIIAQTCRQPGLSTVYTELLDFGGDEIYFESKNVPIGKTFGEALQMYEDSTVIGIHSKGITRLNPPMNTVFHEGDEIIAIAEDDDKVILSDKKDIKINKELLLDRSVLKSPTEKTLILGWNDKSKAIIKEIDQYVVPNSLLTVIAEFSENIDTIKKECLEGIKNLNIEFINADITNRQVLEDIARKGFNHIIILCYDNKPVQEADAMTLIALLHLRDMSEKQGFKYSIVSEMLDIRNRNLAEVTKVNDFIVSDKIISLLISQVSENTKLNSVFTDIFDADGSEIYLKDISGYINLGKPVNFYTIVESAKQKNEVAIGYQIAAEMNEAADNYGIHINPRKSLDIVFNEKDKIIVLSEA